MGEEDVKQKILKQLYLLLDEYKPISITESVTRNAIRMCIGIVKETEV